MELRRYPLVLSLSKDAYRLETHFDRLSANGCEARL
ncbi:hypothetical protein MNBD_ALPHA04-1267 [hydrothermal vent metagenome]|uniref:Uncharacterized protein n=1 Tax=hydrothermal vent metagenome TaxID=652676 RepID=A0A3B0RLK6_9ZZZZ